MSNAQEESNSFVSYYKAAYISPLKNKDGEFVTIMLDQEHLKELAGRLNNLVESNIKTSKISFSCLAKEGDYGPYFAGSIFAEEHIPKNEGGGQGKSNGGGGYTPKSRGSNDRSRSNNARNRYNGSR